jgi:two-component system alkaline phosphatase synthesis response regulator PhoP
MDRRIHPILFPLRGPHCSEGSPTESPLSPKILMVEDQEDRRTPLSSRLEYEGFEVVAVPGGRAALRAASIERPDLVILDLHLPMLEELEVCRGLRREADAPQLPILILSVKGEPVEMMLSSDGGADDFVTLPYDLSELIIRVKSLLRRAATNRPAGTLKAGAIELDRDRYLVSVGGGSIKLTSKEFDLLSVLMKAEGRVVRREVLLEQVWSYERDAGVESRTLDVHVRSLRRKLGREGTRIVTVRSVGYRMSVSPDWIKFGEESPEKRP